MSKFLIAALLIIFFFMQIIFLNANDTYINTTNITYDEENNVLELAENSKININEANILVDRGIIDYDNDLIQIFGNFYLYQELNILSGKNLVGNTKLDNFTANEVSYIYNSDLKIDSDKAQRSKNIVYFYNNFLTPCELEGYFNCPTWSLRIDETRYDIDKDKFNHYDTFLQIADYKVFYLPYFSHYGVKAPRKKGFLTPSFEYNINGDIGLITPYYLPINQSNDIVFMPKLILDGNLSFFNQYEFNTVINSKNSEGEILLDITNKKLENNSNTYSSVKLKANQTLNKKNILSYEALITNSVSTTRSINDDSETFEDIFVRLDSYDIFYKTDNLRAEISTIEALDNTNSGFIPLSPSIKYTNQKLTKNNLTFTNKIYVLNLKRNESSLDKPSENNSIKFDNSLTLASKYKNFNTYNKLTLVNNVGNYSYQHNSALNDDIIKSHIILSSDNFINFNEFIKPRVKFVTNLNILSDNVINEDSKALTFNYQNQFTESRLYGNDIEDNTSRIIYGLENKTLLLDQQLNFNINQSYDFKKETNYTNQINQKSNFSDIALEAKINFDNLNFNMDTRVDNSQLDKKEMNYSLDYSDIFDISLTYNETDSKAFKDLSSDTQSLGIEFGKKINENMSFSFNSNLNLKDNYSPLKQTVNLVIFDECSKLNISYLDERYDDNYNTKPNETVSISFHMDYLGFFGYEQSNNLFFDEPGNFDYGP